MKKVKRQHTIRVSQSFVHHHASRSQPALKRPKERPPIHSQPRDQPNLQSTQGVYILRYIGDSTCLLIGVLVFLWTHDILAFLLMYGIATRQVQIREVIGMFLHPVQHTVVKPETLPLALSRDQEQLPLVSRPGMVP